MQWTFQTVIHYWSKVCAWIISLYKQSSTGISTLLLDPVLASQPSLDRNFAWGCVDVWITIIIMTYSMSYKVSLLLMILTNGCTRVQLLHVGWLQQVNHPVKACYCSIANLKNRACTSNIITWFSHDHLGCDTEMSTLYTTTPPGPFSPILGVQSATPLT